MREKERKREEKYRKIGEREQGIGRETESERWRQGEKYRYRESVKKSRNRLAHGELRGSAPFDSSM